MNPPALKGVTQIVKEAFVQKKKIGALIIPSKYCKKALEFPYLLKVPRMPSIIKHDNSSRKVLLDFNVDFTAVDKLPKELQKFVAEVGGLLEEFELQVDYDYWSTDQILRSILPDELEVPGSFATIGHIGIIC